MCCAAFTSQVQFFVHLQQVSILSIFVRKVFILLGSVRPFPYSFLLQAGSNTAMFTRHHFPTLSLEHPILSLVCAPRPTPLTYKDLYLNYLARKLFMGGQQPQVPLLRLGPPFSGYSFLVHHPVTGTT
jgi:hypothetical protein